MLSFYELSQIMEAGVAASRYGYCPECSKTSGYRPQRLNPWSNRVEKCKYCGTALYAKGDVADNLSATLTQEIEQLEKDPDVIKGMELISALNAADDPAVVYQQFGVDEKMADALIEKAGILVTKKRKLSKITLQQGGQ